MYKCKSSRRQPGWQLALATLLTISLMGSAAFAILQSQQDKLTGNTIETATANLQISTDGTTYQTAQTGFNFSNVVPGGAAVPQSGYSFWLKNIGGTPLALKIAVTTTPTITGNIDLSKVSVILTPVSGGVAQTFSLDALMTAGAGAGTAITAPAQLFVGNTSQFTLKVSMAADAVSGTGATLGNIDFAFSGIAQ